MADLAAVHERVDLVRQGFRLYEAFRPGVPVGESGWGAKGELDLDAVRRWRRRPRLIGPAGGTTMADRLKISCAP